MLVGVSFLNAIWLFQSKRNYKMMHRSPDEAPSASDCKMIELQRDVSHWSSRLPGRLVYYFIAPFTGSSQVKAQKLQVWEMSIWNPSILSRKLFCWFSPAQVLIMSSIDSDNIHIFIPLSIVVAAQVHFLVSVYQSYIKDKQLLFGEMQREYNDKFVHPRIFVRKFDKQVSTETDTSDMGLQTFDGRRNSSRGSSLHNTESTSKRFQHLRVPASSSPLSLPDGVSRFRGPLSSPTSSLSKSSRSSRSLDSGDSESEDGSEDSEEEEEEEEEVDDSEQDDDDEGHTESDNASNEGGSDPDVDYDEEGEEPAMPHPTNALRFND
ncbi:hypothetical protein BGZ99_000790 [Dissophora globulifera]|uniref:Uncharacterized protein n=1 Tax=Dissophora globulifera TaxID=979702 RepID=A0A9P6RS31_9FUNG|nr:hypothetical protein BGZ99_000790 [Dissophora globulifera]